MKNKPVTIRVTLSEDAHSKCKAKAAIKKQPLKKWAAEALISASK